MAHPFQTVTSNDTLPEQADVVVIGAGIIGTTAALDLARRGLKVALLEKGQVAAEQSSRNWGWIRQQGRDRRELPLIIQSLAIWQRLQSELGVDIGFRRKGLLSVTRNHAELERWNRWAQRARAAGIQVKELSAIDAEAAIPSRKGQWIGGLLTPDDAQAEPALAVPAIAEAAQRAGVSLHQQTAVRELDIRNGKIEGVLTEHGRIATPAVLVAAGSWSTFFLRRYGISLPQLNVRSTVTRTTEAPALIEGTFCSSDFCLRRRQDQGFTLTLRGGENFDLVPDGFRYFFKFLPLLRRNFRDVRLRFGRHFFQTLWGERQRRPDQVSRFEEVRVNDPAADTSRVRLAIKRLKHRRPELASVGVAEAWAGRIDMTPDLIPVISSVPSIEGLTIATGFSGHGFGIGPGAGRLAADLVSHTSPIVDPTPFRLSRFTDGTPVFIDPDVI